MNKAQKKGIVCCFALMALFILLIVFFGVSEIQYYNLTKNMVAHTAVITDIQYDVGRGGYIQDVEISYVVEGVTYNRKLGTDTTISFAAGAYEDMKVGNTVSILYNPSNPNEIATEKTSSVGLGVFIFSIFGLLFSIFLLVLIIRGAKKQQATEL